MVQVRNGGKSSPTRYLGVGEATKVASLCSLANYPLPLKARRAPEVIAFSPFQASGRGTVRGATRDPGVSS
jgi:hypothetical protein